MRNPSRSEITSRSEIADKADTQLNSSSSLLAFNFDALPLSPTCTFYRLHVLPLALCYLTAVKRESGGPVNRLFSLVHTIGL